MLCGFGQTFKVRTKKITQVNELFISFLVAVEKRKHFKSSAWRCMSKAAEQVN